MCRAVRNHHSSCTTPFFKRSNGLLTPLSTHALHGLRNYLIYTFLHHRRSVPNYPPNNSSLDVDYPRYPTNLSTSSFRNASPLLFSHFFAETMPYIVTTSQCLSPLQIQLKWFISCTQRLTPRARPLSSDMLLATQSVHTVAAET